MNKVHVSELCFFKSLIKASFSNIKQRVLNQWTWSIYTSNDKPGYNVVSLTYTREKLSCEM